MENPQEEKVAKEVQKEEEEEEEPANFFEIFDAEHQYDHTTFIFDGKEIKIESLGYALAVLGASFTKSQLIKFNAIF
jgi:leucyl aminopeptidase